MTVLMLRLAAPMQAWGSRSRFVRRETERAPTKSGVIGLLAAARGVRRTEELTEFLDLRFGVRIDQPGKLQRDFQTAISLDGRRRMPLSFRYYLADAVFVAAVEGEEELIAGLHDAARRPAFPLYLGRRSCPPAGPIALDVRDGTVREALDDPTWYASEHYQRRSRASRLRLEILRDAEDDDGSGALRETYRDVPLSFDPAKREYGWRSVVHDEATVTNPYRLGSETGLDHDAMAALGG